MPTYEYACQKCGHAFEIFQSMRDDPLKRCPECKKPALKRLVGAGAGLIFKGSGFYITDYKNKGGGKESGGEAKAGGESKSGESKGGESKSGESKPAAEAKSSSESKPASDSKSGGSKPGPAKK